MTTERILRKIKFIAENPICSLKVREEISIVEEVIESIKEFSRRDFLEEKFTRACSGRY